jgi:hypothetical protein
VNFLKVGWHKLVWYPLAIPRHSFFLWLAIRDSLTTKDKMLKCGLVGDMKCLFCHYSIECKEHLLE